jgi:hypothetical protein
MKTGRIEAVGIILYGLILDHLQNLLFCEKARSASIFVAVCVSAR